MKVFLAWLAVLCLVQVHAGDEVHHLRGDSKATPAPKQEEGTVAKEPDTEGKEVPATATAVTAAPKVEPEVGAVAKEPESAKGTETETPQQTGKGAGVVVKEPAAKQPDAVKPEGPPAGVEPEPIYPRYYYPTEEEWAGFDYPDWEDEPAYWEYEPAYWEDERAFWEDVDGYPYEDEVGVAVKEIDPKAQAAAGAAAAAPPASSLVRLTGRRRPGRRPGHGHHHRPHHRPRPPHHHHHHRPGGNCLRWDYDIYGNPYCAYWR